MVDGACRQTTADFVAVGFTGNLPSMLDGCAAYIRRWSPRYSLASLAILLAMTTSAFASEVARPNLQVQLVSDSASVAPGESFQAGLYFRLEEGWHIYWQNAGDPASPQVSYGHFPPMSRPVRFSGRYPSESTSNHLSITATKRSPASRSHAGGFHPCGRHPALSRGGQLAGLQRGMHPGHGASSAFRTGPPRRAHPRSTLGPDVRSRPEMLPRPASLNTGHWPGLFLLTHFSSPFKEFQGLFKPSAFSRWKAITSSTTCRRKSIAQLLPSSFVCSARNAYSMR